MASHSTFHSAITGLTRDQQVLQAPHTRTHGRASTTDNGLCSLRVDIWQLTRMGLNGLVLLSRQCHLQGTLQASVLQGLKPALLVVAQIGPAPRDLARRIDGDLTVRLAHDTSQLPLGHNATAANASPLRLSSDTSLDHELVTQSPLLVLARTTLVTRSMLSPKKERTIQLCTMLVTPA